MAEGVQAPPDLGDTALEIERTPFGPELLDQELAKIGLYLVMARLRGEVTKDVEGTRALRHNPSTMQRPKIGQDRTLSEGRAGIVHSRLQSTLRLATDGLPQERA